MGSVGRRSWFRVSRFLFEVGRLGFRSGDRAEATGWRSVACFARRGTIARDRNVDRCYRTIVGDSKWPVRLTYIRMHRTLMPHRGALAARAEIIPVNLLWVMPAKGDVMGIVIVGAGVLGASAAFHLARMGERVTVIDAGLDGRATAAGAGIICPWVSGVDDPAFYRLYAGGGQYYPALIAALGEAGETETGYRCSGAMLVSRSRRSGGAGLDPSGMARQRGGSGDGGCPSPGSAAQAQAMFPPLRTGLGGVFVSGGARVDGRKLAAAFAAGRWKVPARRRCVAGLRWWRRQAGSPAWRGPGSFAPRTG